MRHRLALLALFCGTVAGQTLPDEASLTVVLRGERPSPAILKAMRQEAQSAIEPSGVRLSWRSQDLGGGDVSGQVAIVEMRGRCSTAAHLSTSPFGFTAEAEPLGQTHVADGKVLPFADLLCDAVHRLVDANLRAARSNQREELLGRALGRVLAHELYHILARTADHGRDGLSRPEQSGVDLLTPGSSLGKSAERRMAESAAVDSGAAGR